MNFLYLNRHLAMYCHFEPIQMDKTKQQMIIIMMMYVHVVMYVATCDWIENSQLPNTLEYTFSSIPSSVRERDACMRVANSPQTQKPFIKFSYIYIVPNNYKTSIRLS